MPYTSPATVVTATTITSAWGNSVKAATDYLANPPACRVFTTATTAFVTGTWGAVPFDSESWDTAAMHSTITNTSRITVPAAGLYIVEGVICFAGNATGLRLAGLRVNSSATNPPNWGSHYANNVGAAFPPHVPISATIKMAANDYVELVAWQSSGGNLNLANENGDNHLSATWIGLG
jgi:hypothetical protein